MKTMLAASPKTLTARILHSGRDRLVASSLGTVVRQECHRPVHDVGSPEDSPVA
jgi:hypothetical protein